MKILAIETSCDETGVAIVDAANDGSHIEVLSNELSSQVDMHREYGGVYPSLAKREHAKNLVPLFLGALKEADLLTRVREPEIPKERIGAIKEVLEREPELFVQLTILLAQTKRPDIDRIAVTVGPGLAPALWVGVNFARALSIAWDIPVVPVNHLEGHVVSALYNYQGKRLRSVETTFPVVSLLVSGGHTELVLSKELGEYSLLGHTRDDAAGEAFDKTARLLGLSYPGGPEVSKLAQDAREEQLEQPFSLPRPMQHSDDYDFSFSGLKTAVLRLTQELKKLDDVQKKQIAREIEDAIVDVLIKKTEAALSEHGAKTLVVSGGVSANKELRRQFTELAHKHSVNVHFPEVSLATDNALMIALVGALKSEDDISKEVSSIGANANLSLHGT